MGSILPSYGGAPKRLAGGYRRLGMLLGGGLQGLRGLTDGGTYGRLEKDMGGVPDRWLRATGSREGARTHARALSEVIRISGGTWGNGISAYW